MNQLVSRLLFLLLIGGLNPVRAQQSRELLQTVITVARQVWRTFPDQRPLPGIEIVPRHKQPVLARFRPGSSPTLLINESLYDLCQTFGTDSLAALALIIGHELTHFHAQHKEWLEIAQYRRASTSGIVTQKQADDLLMLEAFADREGTLHAYLAGYAGFQLLKPLYERIYQTYDLPDNLPGYPTKADRIALSLSRLSSVRPNALLVDAATFLFAMGQYDMAVPCLTAVVQQWPLAELQNNLASLYLKKTLSLTSCREMPFWLPIEWDNYNRLLTLRGSTEESDRTLLLEQAQIYATQAHRTDPDYTPATLNLAITHLLRRRLGTAEDLLDELTQQAQPNPNAMLVRSIVQLKRTNNIADFRRDFTAITGSANELYNRAALDVWPACPPNFSDEISALALAPEPGLGQGILPLPATEILPVTMHVSGSRELRLMGKFDQQTGVDVLRITDRQASRYEILKTNSPAWSTARGLRVGQSEAIITVQYGSPDVQINLNTHYRVYHYKQAGLQIMAREGLICQLIVYRRYP
ncbi:hypothetical protein HNV11_18745 [Spirosoma taeanense]|uniref:Peptidase M48 domain-containing protein n=1 Tax=Spirosoma taeanense TaxID=2735870 RepID=A0A6M5YAP7_9BACT|nr:hypothetical protein [Spirosoma taeanense]QJW91268.1 hypothetical protein HNV11_18745 [Spirosoma taeanense]